MATTPIIQSTGSVSGAGTPGEGRNDLVVGETVTISDSVVANTGATYYWNIADAPIGSAAVFAAPTSATPTFVADVTGSYRITCLVNNAFTATLIVAVPLPATGARIPSFEEMTQYNGGGNAKGWHEALTVFMRNTDADLAAVVDNKTKVTSNDTTPAELNSKMSAGTNVTLTVLNPGGNEQLRVAAADPTVKATTNDTTPAALGSKLAAGTNISIATLNPGANEQLQITSDDTKVKATAADTTPAVLNSKLSAGTNVSFAVLNPAGNEQIQIAAADTRVAVTGTDTTPASLSSKVAAGSGISLAVLNPAGNEQLQITSTATDVNVKASATDTTPSVLNSKLTLGTSLTSTLLNPAGNEQLQLAAKHNIAYIRAGEGRIHGSATPLVVSQFAFSPSAYVAAPTAVYFSVVAAMGNTPLTGNVQLYNLTDSEIVTTTAYVNTTTPTHISTLLTVGAAAGNIKLTEKVYEVRIYVTAPALAIDTIILGTAELRVEF